MYIQLPTRHTNQLSVCLFVYLIPFVAQISIQKMFVNLAV